MNPFTDRFWNKVVFVRVCTNEIVLLFILAKQNYRSTVNLPKVCIFQKKRGYNIKVLSTTKAQPLTIVTLVATAGIEPTSWNDELQSCKQN